MVYIVVVGLYIVAYIVVDSVMLINSIWQSH
jgi:hypothetical protein